VVASISVHATYRGYQRLHSKKHLSFSALRKTVSARVLQFEDTRQEGKVDYLLHDCCLSTFAMMFFQDPSLNTFQRRLEEKGHRNNLKTMFNVSAIPKSSQLREIIDDIPPAEIELLFYDFYRPLQRGKQLEHFEFMDGKYLIPLDGTQYFSSNKISCNCCLTKEGKTTTYYHQVLAATIVCPDVKQVIALAPEPIQNTDGSTKQDCEIKAGKRLVKKIRATHPKLKIIIAGDGLYSKQPFIDELKSYGMSFILVAKPTDHTVLYQWFSDFHQMGETQQLEIKDVKGRRHLYEWVNDIPLNGTKDADNVNYFEFSIFKGDKRTYHNSWVTDIPITENNIIKLVKGGRARWKIENEAFNTLKNQGYHLEHNFGHGKKHLSYNLLLFNFLAFFMHQIFELSDPLYQTCRGKFTSRKEYWNQLRCTIKIFIFPSFESLLIFIIDPERGIPP
jgi:DDE family transposase